VAVIRLSVALSAGFESKFVFHAVATKIVPRNADTCMGIVNNCIETPGFLAPVMTDSALHATGSYLTTFLIVSVFAAVSMASLMILCPPGRDIGQLQMAWA